MPTAAEVAARIRAQLESASFSNAFKDAAGDVQIQDVSSEGSRVRVVYTRPEISGRIGLDIQVVQRGTIDDEARRILMDNVGEPLGSFYQSLRSDAQGIRWWQGEPEDWYYEVDVSDTDS